MPGLTRNAAGACVAAASGEAVTASVAWSDFEAIGIAEEGGAWVVGEVPQANINIKIRTRDVVEYVFLFMVYTGKSYYGLEPLNDPACSTSY